MTDCANHEGVKATCKLTRGHRGKPVPLCDECREGLVQVDPHTAAELIETA